MGKTGTRTAKKVFPVKAAVIIFFVFLVFAAALLFAFRIIPVVPPPGHADNQTGGQPLSRQQTVTPVPTPEPQGIPPPVMNATHLLGMSGSPHGSPDRSENVISYPHIKADSSKGTLVRTYPFWFQGGMVTIALNVSQSLYNGAKNGQKYSVMRQNLPEDTTLPDYFLAFIDDPAQNPFYTDLLNAFRSIKRDRDLSDDEYLELISAFVQSLPYDEAGARDANRENRFPIETFVEGTGVCADKSLLLAGLLSREGYDVSLLVFRQEKHMAVGVRSPALDYRESGYAFIEATNISLVGTAPQRTVGGIPLPQLISDPIVVHVGSGNKSFISTPQVEYIIRKLDEADVNMVSLKGQIARADSDREVFLHNSLVARYNHYAKIHNYVITHEDDRKGTYLYILSENLPTSYSWTTNPAAAGAGSAVYATCNPAAPRQCPAAMKCCAANFQCYLSCPEGAWMPGPCVCGV
jgi:hypothetical protein